MRWKNLEGQENIEEPSSSPVGLEVGLTAAESNYAELTIAVTNQYNTFS
jgi:hypothetical protein